MIIDKDGNIVNTKIARLANKDIKFDKRTSFTTKMGYRDRPIKPRPLSRNERRVVAKVSLFGKLVSFIKRAVKR